MWRALTRLMLTVCVCMMWCDSWAGQRWIHQRSPQGPVGWRQRWEGVRVLDWESLGEGGLQLYQRLLRWGETVSLPSTGMFTWRVLTSSRRSVPSPPGLEAKLAAGCSFQFPDRSSFCFFKHQHLSFWSSCLCWNFTVVRWDVGQQKNRNHEIPHPPPLVFTIQLYLMFIRHLDMY